MCHFARRVCSCLRILSQALKTRVACEPPWKTACSLVSTYFQRSLLEDFYRRQNDIIDSLMEVTRSPPCVFVLLRKCPIKEWRHKHCGHAPRVSLHSPVITYCLYADFTKASLSLVSLNSR